MVRSSFERRAVEEAPVEAAVLELAHRAGVAVGQDRLRPVGRSRDRAERAAIVSSASSHEIRSNFPSPFGRRASSGTAAVGAVDAVEIARHLLAEEPAREGMLRVALQLDGHAILTVTRMLHVSGQSSGQTFLKIVGSEPAMGVFASRVLRHDPRRPLASGRGSIIVERAGGRHVARRLNRAFGLVPGSAGAGGCRGRVTAHHQRRRGHQGPAEKVYAILGEGRITGKES